MNANQTFISLKQMRTFYKEDCEKEGKKFSEKEFELFIECCERDFHQWLRDNVNWFYKEQFEQQLQNTTE